MLVAHGRVTGCGSGGAAALPEGVLNPTTAMKTSVTTRETMRYMTISFVPKTRCEFDEKSTGAESGDLAAALSAPFSA
jgi:hypothetical protein